MIHCLDDAGKPITVLDLCELPLDEAQDHLIALHAEMKANPNSWGYREDCGMHDGVRVIVSASGDERSSLADQRKGYYGLHPNFGLETCWFCWVYDKVGEFAGIPRMMYVVQPKPKVKPRKVKLERTK